MSQTTYPLGAQVEVVTSTVADGRAGSTALPDAAQAFAHVEG
ncbi:hypothetical protein ACFC08_17295 [Streptomyces sp. NPDC056112]|nr:hypothetical protein [Streptomyces sp. HYC2]